MRKLLVLSVCFTGIIFLFFCNCYAASKEQELDRKQIYYLQEQCSKRAAGFFSNRFGKGNSHDKSGQKIDTYTNHYNKKLNKCFILVNTVIIPSNSQLRTLEVETLFDVNENKYYGAYGTRNVSPTSVCEMLTKKCNSETEWYALVTPYMTE